ncbi:MAG TPA: AarF/UbiB family protein [bacterium]|nr:AarF/UbiB family protein [bacterium]
MKNPFSNLQLKYKVIIRLNQIVSILIKNGWGFLVQKLNLFKLPFIKIKSTKKSSEKKILSFPASLRKTFEELGPTYIKFGQILSTRYDLLPLEYIEELSKLQDNVEPIPYEEIEKILKQNYLDLEKIFKEINTTPIASASICQVYNAILYDNTEVILKIKKPFIDDIINTDCEVLKFLLLLFKNYMPELGIDYDEIIDTFIETINAELNLENEINYIQRFKTNFAQNKGILIPKVYDELCSNSIIVMEKIDGIKLTDIINIQQNNININKCLNIGTDAIIQQIFIDGFFHADPHPGNIMITKDNKLAFLDFGMIGRLSPEYREFLFQFIIAVLEKDIEQIYFLLQENKCIQSDINESQLKSDIYKIIDEYLTLPLEKIKINNVFKSFIKIIQIYNIKIPRDFLLLFRALTILDGVEKKISPDFNLLLQLKPLLKKIIRSEYSLTNQFKKFRKLTMLLILILEQIPYDLKNIINKIKSGKLQIEFEHKGLERLEKNINFSAALLAVAIIAGALMISSSFILMIAMTKNIPHLLIPAIIGFVITIILSIKVLYNSFKS